MQLHTSVILLNMCTKSCSGCGERELYVCVFVCLCVCLCVHCSLGYTSCCNSFVVHSVIK